MVDTTRLPMSGNIEDQRQQKLDPIAELMAQVLPEDFFIGEGPSAYPPYASGPLAYQLGFSQIGNAPLGQLLEPTRQYKR